MAPSLLHEKELIVYLEELRNKGYHTIRLNDKCPDGIAIKDGKIIAVELMLFNGTGDKVIADKLNNYSMFDYIFIRKIKRVNESLLKKKDLEWKTFDLDNIIRNNEEKNIYKTYKSMSYKWKNVVECKKIEV